MRLDLVRMGWHCPEFRWFSVGIKRVLAKESRRRMPYLLEEKSEQARDRPDTQARPSSRKASISVMWCQDAGVRQCAHARSEIDQHSPPMPASPTSAAAGIETEIAGKRQSPKVIMLREAERTFGDDSGGSLELGGKEQRRAKSDEPDQDERNQCPGVRTVSRRDDGHDDCPRDRSAKRRAEVGDAA